MEAELERQTEASLRRQARNTALANVLIVAAVLFLICAKWLISLNGRRPPELSKVLAQHTEGPGRIARPSDRIGPLRLPGNQSDCAEDDEADLRFVDQAIERLGRSRDVVIPMLQAIQSHYRYLPEAALRHVCEGTAITPARIIGVSSFYRQFRRAPVGRHILKVCHGTACHVAGARRISDEIRRYLGIEPDADTDPQRLFTIEEVACLGCCTLAPVMQIDGVTYGHLAPDMIPDVLNTCLAEEGTDARRPAEGSTARSDEALAPLGEIRVGLGSCCVAGGSGRVYEALEQAVEATGARATIKRVGCVGMCHQTPLVETVLPGQPSSFYAGVGPEDARSIVRRHFRPRGIGRRMAATASTILENLTADGQRQPITKRSIEVRDPPVAAFLGPQKHIATEHCGRLDPTDLDEYVQRDGLKALKRCIKQLTPAAVIDEITRSGLRGRGGAGYPTGLKWSKVHDADGPDKYIICNGDEGDPGAFMDRMLMESFPYRIIEGMTIAAFAVGAREGYFYIRAEYPLAVQRIRDALQQCEQRNLLGPGILGTPAALRLHIMEGAGAFVCGEETALLASIEGNRGSPRLRPPYPADSGLWGKPTLVGNVETFATVPWIMRNGADAFAELGTATSKGTKVFALAGKINRGGLIEVPMGITVRQIVSDIGGGIKEGRRFKAVQIGGPSGGCIPAAMADTPIDYEALHDAGAIMGSGGLVVLDESDCMVDIARYFLSFTQDQSCGRCTHCRIGTRRMLDILNRLCAGEGRKGDLETLEQLGRTIRLGALCGLGGTAPNPVLSTLRYFRDEYEAHLEGRCPAGKCKELITYRVTDDCIGCTLCAQHCPSEAIRYAPYEKHEIDAEKCTCCDICRAKCPEQAIEVY
jgi:NADH:ubiquinone oxidoreductase subunit F (NADH-binding)/NADH:ubiquinone oxidoreductase subunit E/Pyruvate/2-oxoacid:ferredoxin oxidoreductase delta subunit